jgi:hypothetical protein
LVFGRRHEARTHRQRLLDELAESYSHLKLAAGHAAGGAAERLTPPYDRAQEAANRRWGATLETLAPLYEQMREGAANARREHGVRKKKRWPLLVGLLAAGTAAGAVGAIVARRRRDAAQWDEYDPMPAVSGTNYGDNPHAGHRVTSGAASVADSVSAQAGKIADSLHERSGQGSANSNKDGTRPTGLAGMSEPIDPGKGQDKPKP